MLDQAVHDTALGLICPQIGSDLSLAYSEPQSILSVNRQSLVNNTIRLTHFDSRWQQEFQQTRSSILLACEGRVSKVSHVGSTAIPGMIARPIVDVLATVANNDDFADAVGCIEGLNYRVIATPSWIPTATLLIKPRSGETTHHVYLTKNQDPIAGQMIRLKDYLLANNESQLRYESAKVGQWKSKRGNPESYVRAKAIFFAHVLDQMNA